MGTGARSILLVVLALVLVTGGVIAATAASDGGGGEPGPAVPVGTGDASTVSGPTDTGAVDVSGPCDEPEHADDPRCAGPGSAPKATTTGGLDVSGPCDEVEHANDPRCAPGGDDRSGKGRGRGGRSGRG